MAKHIDKEIEAIKAVLDALEPLTSEARVSVLDYAIKCLQIDLEPVQKSDASRTWPASADPPPIKAKTAADLQTVPVHIKDLKEKKKPRSANEMAALVGYYLANEAVPTDRKENISEKNINTYFKIAEFPLPEKSRFTLSNAKAAGYLDAIGNGEYKLNAVGHNLIVHSMPRGKGGKAVPRRKAAKKK